ncbi:MAG TPA: 3-oxoacyl-[acyl-carrier-protein] synthase III C-terminal domain-containing protein [Enhygromyxa sp.]|nr:3-oxoacyl-[acyl-carrier-protein] synthase III C-terminal domain-containing protein [Enhygromyxa sp.]
MSRRVGVLAVASASPEHRLSQARAKQFARGFFADDFSDDGDAELERLLEVYENAGVETRHIGRPIEWLEQKRSFPEKNAAYREQALQLATRAAAVALEQAGIDRREYGAIVFASSTGLSTPSLDARLVQNLELPRTIHRAPLWGLGCAGGGAGLARARALALGLQKPVLVIACELCSLTFVHGDRRKSNLVAVALFGDGAAAAVVAPEPHWRPGSSGHGPELLGGYARLIDDSEHIMGWDLEDEGLRVRFAPTIPDIVIELAAEMVGDALASVGLSAADRHHLVVHPGGRKVLDAWESALGLDPERLRYAREVLRDHGNMSSPTVLFVLERFLASTAARGEPGLLLALGPGFCAEGVVFRW